MRRPRARGQRLGEGFGAERAGDEVGLEVEAGQGLGRRGADGGELQGTQGAEVAPPRLQALEEEPDPVARGEDEPVELAQAVERRSSGP